MKKLIAVLALGMVAAGGVALGAISTEPEVDAARVEQTIDHRLHDLLVQARLQRHGR